MSDYLSPPLSFMHAEKHIEAGRRQIRQNGELTIDATNLADGNTLAVCALIAWRRTAMAENCQLRFINIPTRLQQLIDLYQLRELLTPLNSIITVQNPD